jgi:hypothetical protein
MIKAKYEMGKIAMEILLQMIEGKDEGNRQVALHHRCLFTIVLIVDWKSTYFNHKIGPKTTVTLCTDYPELI